MTTRPGLRLVNALHRRLSPSTRRRFFYLCSGAGWPVEGRWIVDFAGRDLVLPLSHDFADSWELAISFHGYDQELHAFYETLVRSDRPPRVVFDVGANYGLHALRFLAHDAHAIAFEPNPACHGPFRLWCEANDLPCHLEPVAVGDCSDSVVLAFPEGRNYLGSVVPEARADWDGAAVRTLTVPQVTLDDVAAARNLVPDLVKIDTEGAELGVLRVLRGARKLLDTAQPTLVFESWPTSPDRMAIWALLAEHGYAIAVIDGAPPRALTRAAFADARATNFVAEVPPGRVIHSAHQ